MSDSTWCPLPWIHQFITTDGIKTCCDSLYQENSSPNTFVESKTVIDIKNSILENKKHAHCKNCFKLEDMGFTSARQKAIIDFEQYNRNNIPSVIEYYDLRYNNLCNFSCRMCNSEFSSSIGNLILQNPKLEKFYPITTSKHNNFANIINDINSNLSNIKKINFTGGEPLLNKDNLLILKKLYDLGKTDCEICITTNASVINNQWIDLLKNFKTVHWTISIDGVEKTAEYIRVGTKWPVVKNNILSILNLGHSVAFNTTLTAYSVLDLSKLIQFFIQLKKEAKCPFEQWFGLCNYPNYLNPNVLYDEYAQKARLELNKSIELLLTVKNNPKFSVDQLQSVKNNIFNKSSQQLTSKFLEFTKVLDSIHDMSFESVFNLRNPYV